MSNSLQPEQSPGQIHIQTLTESAQFDQCVELQDLVWGYDLSGMMTQKVFLLASQIGGQVLGAFVAGKLAGYAMSLPGIRNGQAYLHSHHLAVLPNYRNLGLGRRLKLAQREDAIARGIDLMEWTFDPLEIKNSYLNFTRLGAISRRYKRDFYGTSSSPLHGGLPTDRIFAEWWLNSDHVRRVLAGETSLMEATGHVDVPAALAHWKTSDALRPRALAVQSANASALESAFASGLAVIGYELSPHGDGRFQIGVWNEAGSQ